MVASRLIIFLESLRDISLKCCYQLREFANDAFPSSTDESVKRSCQKKSARCVTAVEERFCTFVPLRSPLLNDEIDNDNLPVEGHFVIDAFLESSGTQNDGGQACVTINLEMYSHTIRGNALVDKVRAMLPGEIRRTKRKWRRHLKSVTSCR